MDKLIKMLAPFGVMGIVFIVAFTTAMSDGLSKAPAFTSAMARIGPGGMIGGLISLGITGIVSALIAEFGSDYVVLGIIDEQLKTNSRDEIWNEINAKKLVSRELKLKINDYLYN